jgi:hypothetical protein
VEPFAGSAAYATRYHDRRVLLVDLDPSICGVWRYLTRVRESELAALPLFREGDTHIDELGPLIPEARLLIGFWMFTGSSFPRDKRSSWAHTEEYADRFWGPQVRDRLCRQVPFIRHWHVKEGSYQDIGNLRATWFVDPPYQKAGVAYTQSSSRIDFDQLSRWCRGRDGDVLVCENVGATWLPFRPFYTGTANRAKASAVSEEALFAMKDGMDMTDEVLANAQAQQIFDRILDLAGRLARAKEEARSCQSEMFALTRTLHAAGSTSARPQRARATRAKVAAAVVASGSEGAVLNALGSSDPVSITSLRKALGGQPDMPALQTLVQGLVANGSVVKEGKGRGVKYRRTVVPDAAQ